MNSPCSKFPRLLRFSCGPLAALSLAATLLSGATDTTMFRGDPAHSGIYAGEGPKVFKGVKWTFKTGGAVVSSPAIIDGVIYVGSDDKNVYAIDEATGVEKWKFATGSLVRSSPAVGGKSVFFSSYDGVFYAVDKTTGKQQWKFEIPGERHFSAKGLHGYFPRQQVIPDFWDVYQSSPVLGGGYVYFGCGDGNLYAFDTATGGLKWKFATGDVVHATPAFVDGTLYCGSWDSWFYAIDAASGTVKWKFKTGEDPVNFNQTGLPSSPCVVDGTVYFGCRDSHVYALDARTGEQKWKYLCTWVIASPTVRDGRVYGCTSIPEFFFALDAKTGAEIYKTDIKVSTFASPALAGPLAYFGSFGGTFYAADTATGKIVWSFQTPAAKANARGALTADGKLDFKNLFTSQNYEDMYFAAEKLFSLGAFLSSPVVDQGVVYVGSTDGNLYALE